MTDRRSLIDTIHDVLATGNGCRHPRFGASECERVAAALSDHFTDHLADALHAEADSFGSALSEFDCYCRRIATADGTKDGPQSDTWDTKPYDPEYWGVTDPTLCEQSAARIVATLLPASTPQKD